MNPTGLMQIDEANRLGASYAYLHQARGFDQFEGAMVRASDVASQIVALIPDKDHYTL